jgi:hypothetical protein
LLYQKTGSIEVIKKSEIKPRNFHFKQTWYAINSANQKEEIYFDYRKPNQLLKYISMNVGNDFLSLIDFFGGSGTTGQAMIDLIEDGGNHGYNCTNSERLLTKN